MQRRSVMSKKQIRWVIAHEPVDLFLKAAKKFAQEVYDKTHGQYDIEILSLTEYSDKYNGGSKITKHDLVGLMEQGQVELSQMYTYVLGEYVNDFWALDMPYLFKDHDHADKVFEGAIGQHMLDQLAAKSHVRGLSFTYSGGYKCLPSKKPITTIEDFKGTRIRTSNNPVSQDIFRSVGAEPIKDDIENMTKSGLENRYEAGESTYVRIFESEQHKPFPNVVDAEHALLITSIIVADGFWQDLDPAVQSIFSTAAINAGRAERTESIELNDSIKDDCPEQGVSVYVMDEKQRERFRQATAWMYEKYDHMFTPGLIDSIKQLH